jgi:tetratricopeptide (TPR) repeat protein
MSSNGNDANVLARLRERLIDAPNDGKTLFELGEHYASQHNLNAAMNFLCQAIASEQRNARYYSAFGSVLYRGGRNLEAICAFRQALALDADLATAYNGLGCALRRAGELELASACYRNAVHRDASDTRYWANLAFALLDQNQFRKAYQMARKSHALNHRYEDAYFGIIESLLGQRRFTAAEAWLQKAKGTFSKWGMYHNQARILHAQNQIIEAERFYRKAIALKPNEPPARFGLALCLLALGKFAEGWEEYEWRFKVPGWIDSKANGFVQELTEPMWAGENIEGKTLLVYAEQGFGDNIQLIRYIPELIRRGCRVILMVYDEILELVRALPSPITTIQYGDLIPRYDYHTPLFSLPRMLKTTVETIPRTVPYLPTPTPPVSKAAALLRKPAKLRIGFVWSTKPLGPTDYRNVSLASLERLFKCRSVRFYSLQINERAKDLEAYAHYSNVHDLKAFIKNWSDTASFISQLDLILSIDTGLTHLAGALGKPVWLMLPRSTEWRWLSPKKNSIWYQWSAWYPTIRLFRSSSFFSWDSLAEEIRRELLRASRNPEAYLKAFRAPLTEQRADAKVLPLPRILPQEDRNGRGGVLADNRLACGDGSVQRR